MSVQIVGCSAFTQYIDARLKAQPTFLGQEQVRLLKTLIDTLDDDTGAVTVDIHEEDGFHDVKVNASHVKLTLILTTRDRL